MYIFSTNSKLPSMHSVTVMKSRSKDRPEFFFCEITWQIFAKHPSYLIFHCIGEGKGRRGQPPRNYLKGGGSISYGPPIMCFFHFFSNLKHKNGGKMEVPEANKMQFAVPECR